YSYFVIATLNGESSSPSKEVVVSPVAPTVGWQSTSEIVAGLDDIVVFEGSDTHFDVNASSCVMTKQGGTGIEKLVLDVSADGISGQLEIHTSISATLGIWQVEIVTANVWGQATYVETTTFEIEIVGKATVESPPSVRITNPTSSSVHTSAFTVSVSFDTNGGSSIDTSTFEFEADVPVTVNNVTHPAFTNLSDPNGVNIFTIVSSSGASAVVDQLATGVKFEGAFVSFRCKVSNTAGLTSRPVTVTNVQLDPQAVRVAHPLKLGVEQDAVLTGNFDVSKSYSISIVVPTNLGYSPVEVLSVPKPKSSNRIDVRLRVGTIVPSALDFELSESLVATFAGRFVFEDPLAPSQDVAEMQSLRQPSYSPFTGLLVSPQSNSASSPYSTKSTASNPVRDLVDAPVLDENGVSLASGTIIRREVDVSIPTPSGVPLSFERVTRGGRRQRRGASYALGTAWGNKFFELIHLAKANVGDDTFSWYRSDGEVLTYSADYKIIGEDAYDQYSVYNCDTEGCMWTLAHISNVAYHHPEGAIPDEGKVSDVLLLQSRDGAQIWFQPVHSNNVSAIYRPFKWVLASQTLVVQKASDFWGLGSFGSSGWMTIKDENSEAALKLNLQNGRVASVEIPSLNSEAVVKYSYDSVGELEIVTKK
ncbi:MAG: hypothetical protein KDB07_12390, partial [Planctomycetes bacterium]|nr:hypothetical protein [Planctomycetota bacterium]